jgi:hypothetical protein
MHLSACLLRHRRSSLTHKSGHDWDPFKILAFLTLYLSCQEVFVVC